MTEGGFELVSSDVFNRMTKYISNGIDNDKRFANVSLRRFPLTAGQVFSARSKAGPGV